MKTVCRADFNLRFYRPIMYSLYMDQNRNQLDKSFIRWSFKIYFASEFPEIQENVIT